MVQYFHLVISAAAACTTNTLENNLIYSSNCFMCVLSSKLTEIRINFLCMKEKIIGKGLFTLWWNAIKNNGHTKKQVVKIV